jgi:hypothetical protein
MIVHYVNKWSNSTFRFPLLLSHLQWHVVSHLILHPTKAPRIFVPPLSCHTFLLRQSTCVTNKTRGSENFSAKNGSIQIVRWLTHTDEYNIGKLSLEEGTGLSKYNLIGKKFDISTNSCGARLLLFCVGLSTSCYVAHLNFCVGIRRYTGMKFIGKKILSNLYLTYVESLLTVNASTKEMSHSSLKTSHHSSLKYQCEDFWLVKISHESVTVPKYQKFT